MAGDVQRICVVGGGSRIAAALRPLLGEAATFVARRPGGAPNTIIVDDYRALNGDMLAGMTSLINCVGISVGSPAELQRVNVDIPRHLAATAKAAGLRRFIHISSFSVYGGAPRIDRTTATAPTSDYGRSKLAADAALLAMSADDFTATILRLPLIYGGASLGKLGQLLRWWSRARVLPAPASDVSRAMISVDLAAAVLARLVNERRAGIVFAADPRPFTYADAAQASGGGLRLLPLPPLLTRAVERVAPGLGSRLFADSHLAEADNLAIEYGLASRLYADIAAADLR